MKLTSSFPERSIHLPARKALSLPEYFRHGNTEQGDGPLILIEHINGKWSCEVHHFEAPLQKGLRIKVARTAVKNGSPDGSEIICRLVDWHYQIKDAEHSTLVLLVKEEKPLEPDPKTEDRRVFAGITVGILSVFFFFGIAYTCYLNPDDTWAFAGRHVRFAGGLALFVVFSFLLPVRLGLNRRVTFLNSFYWSVLNVAGLILISLWLSLASLPAQFSGTPQEYGVYARALTEKFSTSYWPVVVAGLPWLAIAFKAFGLERAERTADALQDVAKKGG